MSEYERPDPEVLFGPERAEDLFGQRQHCRWCERIHRPGWVFADCLTMQFHALTRVREDD